MLTDRVHSMASKRVTSWSKFQLPGYWVVLQVLVAAGFVIFLLFQAIGGDESEQAVGVPGFEDQAPGVSTPVPGVTDTPATSPTQPAPGASSTTGVVDVSGTPVDVPEGAASAAAAGLRSMFDPAAAATVPVTGGGTLPAPARAFPDATVGSLVFVSADGPDRLSFAATTDADGAGTAFGSVNTTITVVREGDSWLVEVI